MGARNLESLSKFARRLAVEAEAVILPYYHGHFSVELKGDASPVTEADRAAERRIRSLIAEAYPDHAVLGEEYGESGPHKSSHRWVIDPIDGTVSFTCRVPLFGTLIALEVEGEPVVGVAHFPALAETYWGVRGEGAFRGGTPIRARRCERLSDAVLCATGFHSSDLSGTGEPPLVSWPPLLRAVKLFRGWGDCYGHALVASGRADAMIDVVMRPWDNAALIPILEEAGASVSSIEGRTDDLVRAGSLVSCAPGLQAELLEVLSSARAAVG